MPDPQGRTSVPVEEPIWRYRSDEEDSDRWRGFEFRPGDIVISTRSKSGTTWLQMICALLVHGSTDLPAPLWALSPWLDWLLRPRSDVIGELAAQPHRRIIKTHTPLDGVPIDPRVTYIVTGRHPLDQALSLWHQGNNLDQDRIAALTMRSPDRPDEDSGSDPGPVPDLEPEPERDGRAGGREQDSAAWLRSWIDADVDPRTALDSLPGVMHHLGDAWGRRHRSNVVLVHYGDLVADLAGEMARVARAIGSPIEVSQRPDLVAAARFDSMRDRADDLAPDPVGVLRDRSSFFRSGRIGDGVASVGPEDLDRYRSRVAGLGPTDLIAWLHEGRSAVEP